MESAPLFLSSAPIRPASNPGKLSPNNARGRIGMSLERVQRPPTIIFTDLDDVLDNSRQGTTAYSGARAVRASFFHSVLRYAPLERIILLATSGTKRALTQLAARHETNCPVEALTWQDIVARNLQADVVSHSLNANLNRGIYLRQICGNASWLAVGMTHDLSHPAVVQDLLLAHCAGLHRGDAIFCCSEAAKSALREVLQHVRRLLRLDAETLAFPTIPYGVEMQDQQHIGLERARAALKIPGSAFVFLFFGRLSGLTKADLKDLIRSYAQAAFGGETILLLAGALSGPHDEAYLERARNLIFELGLNDRVRFFLNPSEAKKHEIFSAADVFVTPANSLQESFGVALVEAMAHALPVIATNWNGYRDIVVHGETGFLVSTRFGPAFGLAAMEAPFESDMDRHATLTRHVDVDHVEMAHFMLVLEKNRDLAKEMGSKGARRAMERFAWQAIIPQHVEHWSNLCAVAQRTCMLGADTFPFVDYERAFCEHPGAAAT
jgi:glycosyltransferase involved in cell wall biosynthesis